MKLVLALLLSLAAPAMADVPLVPGAWIPIGPEFGGDKTWKFGLDTSPTAGICGQYNVPDAQYEIGACRDFLLLSRRGVAAMHLGASVLFPVEDIAQSHPGYSARLGLNVGPAASAALLRLSEKIPLLEKVTSYPVPKWASYMGKITSVDVAGGWRPNPMAGKSRWPWGVQAKVDVPLGDLWSLLKGG